MKSLAAARRLLINQLVLDIVDTPHQVIVVFDGNGVSEQSSQDRRVRIVYSRAGETADNSAIARLLLQHEQRDVKWNCTAMIAK